MPLYNSAKYVALAIESLLNQTYYKFKIIAVDDCSSDATGEIIKYYESIDNRILYIKNEKRIGMIMNWRKTFNVANKSELDYFAWASDHDILHPRWLQSHVEILNNNPDVVLAYPLRKAIDKKGRNLKMKPTRFNTDGMRKDKRVRSTCTKIEGSGNMVYGLMRAAALERCGVFPYCIMPDRLLMMKLSIHGAFKQIEEYLWYRRYCVVKCKNPSVDYDQMVKSQKKTLFNDTGAPWHSDCPVIAQAIGIVHHVIFREARFDLSNILLGATMAFRHLKHKRQHLKKEGKILLKLLAGIMNI
jgi:glycosyltransferase involved in cell wall biosynthesis